MHQKPARVFVTGLGIISPAGDDLAAFWADLVAGRNRFAELAPLYAGMKPGVLGGRVPPRARAHALAIVDEQTHAVPRAASVFAEYAALAAVRDAGLRPGDDVLSGALVCIGSSDGQADALEDLVAGRGQLTAARFAAHSIADGVARQVGAAGPAFTVQNTCASANVALSCALEMLRAGVADTAVVGGCDAYSEKNIIGFSSLHAVGPVPCRPFAVDRRYVTPSEGAGVLVLQTERSLRSDRQPYAEVLAVAVNNDARHPTAPDMNGVAACHRLALRQAEVGADDISAVLAHGTGTRMNDEIEAAIFRADYPLAAVTAIKGTVGHLMGAAGAAGAVTACLCLRFGQVPPTAVDADAVEPDVNLVVGAPRRLPGLRYVQSNAFGFGGNNAIAIFRRPE